MTERHSTAIKGFAILLVLVHHLFFRQPQMGVWYFVAVVAKVSVAVFLAMSGFGLAESWKRRPPARLRDYYVRRVTGLYKVYWPTWLVLVPLTLLITGRSLESLYGPGYLGGKLVVEFLGLQMLFRMSGGMNPTWWFMTLILLLYLLFPVLRYLVVRFGLAVPALTLIAALAGFPRVDRFLGPVSLDWLWAWLPAFVLGIWLSARFDLAPALRRLRARSARSALAALAVLAPLAWLRFRMGADDVRIDAVIAVPLIVLAWLSIERFSPLSKLLAAFGAVSFEIFLTHTLLMGRWFPDWFYALREPALIVLALAATSLVFAWVWQRSVGGVLSVMGLKARLQPARIASERDASDRLSA